MDKVPLAEYAERAILEVYTSLEEAHIGYLIALDYSEQQLALEMLKDEQIYQFWNKHPAVRRAYEYARKNLPPQEDDNNTD